MDSKRVHDRYVHPTIALYLAPLHVRGFMDEVVFRPRDSVSRTCTPSRMPLAARVVKSARRTSSFEGTPAIRWIVVRHQRIGHMCLHCLHIRTSKHTYTYTRIRTLEVHGFGRVHQSLEMPLQVEDPAVVNAQAFPDGISPLWCVVCWRGCS